MDSNITIGRRIRELRKAAGMTQGEVAEHLHIQRSGLAKIERGENGLSIEHGVTLAEAFGVPIEYVYSGVRPEAVDYSRTTGLKQLALDGLTESRAFACIINAIARHRKELEKAVALGCSALYDVEAKHLGEERRTAEDYSTALDYPQYQAARVLAGIFRECAADPELWEVMFGRDDPAVQSWGRNGTAREVIS